VPRAYDAVLLGAGGAGQLVLLALTERDPDLRVAVVDPAERTGWDRTWCFWAAGESLVDEVVEGRWRRLLLAGGGRDPQVLDLDPLTYRLVRSDAVYALAARRLGAATRLRVDRVRASAGRVVEDGRGAVVETSAGALRASWVLDSRPSPPARPAGVTWVQSFVGRVLPAAAAPDLGGVPVFMDFRTAQPARGLSFGYCLPLAGGAVLVEYTEFGPRPLDPGHAEPALDAYLALLGGDPAASPIHVERGAIPMTDAPFARRAGARTVRLGTAGGATRPSTGYTFAAMTRQAEAVATALAVGSPPAPPAAYPARHRVLDGALLRALDDGLVDGPAFFRRLFARHPAERVLRFLDGASTPAEELRIMASSPRGGMATAIARVLTGRGAVTPA
jgi:lycopene beta-cyclase